MIIIVFIVFVFASNCSCQAFIIMVFAYFFKNKVKIKKEQRTGGGIEEEDWQWIKDNLIKKNSAIYDKLEKRSCCNCRKNLFKKCWQGIRQRNRKKLTGKIRGFI